MPSTNEIKTQIASTLPPQLHEDVSHFVDAAMQPRNANMTTEELLNLLVADPRIAHLLSELPQQAQNGGIGTGNPTGQMAGAVTGDKIGGDKIGGDKIGGDKIGGD